MTILGMWSFDQGYTEGDVGWYYVNGSPHITDNLHARTGSRSFRIQNYGAFAGVGIVGTDMPVASSTAWAQGAYYWEAGEGPSTGYTNGAWGNIQFLSASGYEVMVGFDAQDQYRIKAYRGTKEEGNLLGQSEINQFTADVWLFLEATVVIHDTAGSVLVKLNGVSVIDVSGVDTKKTGSTINRIWVANQCPGNAYAGSQCLWLDDFMIGNGDTPNGSPPGDARVEYLVPIANGAKTQFTPSAGNNWSNVDEIGSGVDTDYNWESEIGTVDVFSMSNLSGNGTIHAVQSVIRAAKDDAGYRLVRPAFYKPIGQGDTIRLYTDTPTAAVADGFGYSRKLFMTSLDTGSAWTVEEINDIQFGYAIGGGSQFSLDCWIEES